MVNVCHNTFGKMSPYIITISKISNYAQTNFNVRHILSTRLMHEIGQVGTAVVAWGPQNDSPKADAELH